MTRHAIYGIPGAAPDDAPEAVALRRDVESWLTRDDVRDVTVDARRYGFHATIKAPFRLADGVDEDALVAAVGALAASHAPVVVPSLRATAMGAFRALVPGAPHEQLLALAADVVRDLDHLRAPLTDAEVARREPTRLTERQRELLEAWGYPYVLDELRLHMTLTDRLDAARGAVVDAAIAEHLGAHLGADVPMTSLAISVERTPGAPFAIHSIHPLGARAAIDA